MTETNPFDKETTAAQWVRMLELDHSLAAESDRVAVVYAYILAWLAGNGITQLVDIGCGEGYLGSLIPSNVAYLGLEPSRYLLEMARSTYQGEHLAYRPGSAYASTLADGSAQGVVSVMVWFHLQNLEKAAAEVARILQPEGKFLLITSNSLARAVWEGFFQNPKIEANTLTGRFNTSLSNLEENVIYLHPNEELVASLQQAGLQIDRLEPIGLARLPEEKLFIAVSGTKPGLA